MLAFVVYDTDTVHLLTRHHRALPPKGYAHPLTDSGWLLFFTSVFITMALLHWGNVFLMSQLDSADILPLLVMFHQQDRSPTIKAIINFRVGEHLNRNFALLY